MKKFKLFFLVSLMAFFMSACANNKSVVEDTTTNTEKMTPAEKSTTQELTTQETTTQETTTQETTTQETTTQSIECKVDVSIDFIGNLMFSKYDVIVSVDGEIKLELPHGTDGNFSFTGNSGKHEIVFTNAENSKVNGKIILNVTKDEKVSLRIDCTKDKVNVAKIEPETKTTTVETQTTKETQTTSKTTKETTTKLRETTKPTVTTEPQVTIPLPNAGTKLAKDFDSKSSSSVIYMNVDAMKNIPQIKKWGEATVTDSVAEYLDKLTNEGYSVKITSKKSNSQYAGFTEYETNFTASKDDVSWNMYCVVQDGAYVEYEFDIYLPKK